MSLLPSYWECLESHPMYYLLKWLLSIKGLLIFPRLNFQSTLAFFFSFTFSPLCSWRLYSASIMFCCPFLMDVSRNYLICGFKYFFNYFNVWLLLISNAHLEKIRIFNASSLISKLNSCRKVKLWYFWQKLMFQFLRHEVLLISISILKILVYSNAMLFSAFLLFNFWGPSMWPPILLFVWYKPLFFGEFAFCI